MGIGSQVHGHRTELTFSQRQDKVLQRDIAVIPHDTLRPLCRRRGERQCNSLIVLSIADVSNRAIQCGLDFIGAVQPCRNRDAAGVEGVISDFWIAGIYGDGQQRGRLSDGVDQPNTEQIVLAPV